MTQGKTGQNEGRLTPFETSPDFTCLQYKSFESTVRKGEIARDEQFLLFPQCFLRVWRTCCHFIKFEIVICKFNSLRKG